MSSKLSFLNFFSQNCSLLRKADMSNTYVCTRLILTCHITKYSPKQGNIQVYPNSQNHACGKKCFKNNNHSSFHWHEICSVFVCGHCLFLKSSVFLVLHSRNCLLHRTDILQTKLMSTFPCQMEALVYIFS